MNVVCFPLSLSLSFSREHKFCMHTNSKEGQVHDRVAKAPITLSLKRKSFIFEADGRSLSLGERKRGFQ